MKQIYTITLFLFVVISVMAYIVYASSMVISLLLNVILLAVILFVFYKNRNLTLFTQELSEEETNTFIANMSHEIRTPLNGIVGFTDLLHESNLNEEQANFVSIIKESSHTLSLLIDDILDYSKARSGKVELEELPFDILEKFEITIESYSAKVAQKSIELGLFIDPSVPKKVMGDANKLSQVMLNLLSNAIKFTPENGLVNVSIEKISEESNFVEIRFSVKDSGKGIPKDKIDKIFEAFAQESASTSREFGGTGLGLSISKQFVELMGGELRIVSKPKRGTDFYFNLKLKKVLNVQREKSKIVNKTIGYVIPKGENDYESIDNNVQKYVNATGATFKTYYASELLENVSQTLPDFLLVNHRYNQDEAMLKRLLSLNTKTILVTCADPSKLSSFYHSETEEMILKPINYSKIIHVLDKNIRNNRVEAKKEEILFNVKNLHILIADDNIINQKLLVNLLEKMNVTVTVANDGKEAFEYYAQNKYHMILMDILMPKMTGLESTQKIRAYENQNGLRATPIIALTANHLQKDLDNYLKEGMDDYVNKPIDLDELKRAIKKYTDHQEELQETLVTPTLANEHKIKPLNKIKKDTKAIVEEPKSIEKVEQKECVDSNAILLYKENLLMGTIFEKILSNLNHETVLVKSKEEFKVQLSQKEFKYLFFDILEEEKIIDEELIVLIKASNASAFAFADEISNEAYCKVIPHQITQLELKKLGL